jgi:DNA-binding transcriptional MerR regulator
MNYNNDNIQDAEFEESNDTKKFIRGEAIYYSTSQVANILGVADSKIRYYTNQFDDILHIEISNKQRRYTEQDIDKLKFIVDLKNQGLTIKQIQEYCQEVDVEHGLDNINEKNPLSIQTLAKALMEEQQHQLNEFKTQMIEAMSLKLQEQIDVITKNNEINKAEIVEQVALTVDSLIDEKLNNHIDLLEKRETEREAKMIKALRDSMEERKLRNESENQDKPKRSLLQRLLNK